MKRRDFLRSLFGSLAALFLPFTSFFRREPVILDGQWHLLRLIDGKATVDDIPWAAPWLTGRMRPEDGLDISLLRPSTTVELRWVKCWQRLSADGDKDGPEVCEMRFRAQSSNGRTVVIDGAFGGGIGRE